MLTIRIAELNIGIKYRYEYTRQYVKEYITELPPDFIIEATDEDLRQELMLSEEPLPNEYLEHVALYRKIADKLTEYDGAVFHGAVIEMNGLAYAVTARSGVGKTTHVRLWLQKYGDAVSVLNGDKPVLRVIDGIVYACGTPWQGKEGYGRNVNRPLAGIAFLERGAENSYECLSSSESVVRFMSQIYMNKSNPSVTLRTLRLADRILSDVPLFRFSCNMELSAAEMAYEAFVNNKKYK